MRRDKLDVKHLQDRELEEEVTCSFDRTQSPEVTCSPVRPQEDPTREESYKHQQIIQFVVVY